MLWFFTFFRGWRTGILPFLCNSGSDFKAKEPLCSQLLASRYFTAAIWLRMPGTVVLILFLSLV